MTDYNDEQLTLFDIPLKPPVWDYSYIGLNRTPLIHCPRYLLRAARYVGSVSWARRPAYIYEDTYWLSTNRSYSHWILWFGRVENGEAIKWEIPCAYGPKSGVRAKTAAAKLLLASWRGETVEYRADPVHFHTVTGEGLLSADEIYALAERVWPRSG